MLCSTGGLGISGQRMTSATPVHDLGIPGVNLSPLPAWGIVWVELKHIPLLHVTQSMPSPAGPVPKVHAGPRVLNLSLLQTVKYFFFFLFLTCPVSQTTSQLKYPYAEPEECPPGTGTRGAFGPEPCLPPPFSLHYCARQEGTPSGAGRIKARELPEGWRRRAGLGAGEQGREECA